ncbi:MAG: tetratricopeptide repeat protein [Steroidobacteraceae bacterium]
MGLMRPSFWCQILALLLAETAAVAQVSNSSQGRPAATPTSPENTVVSIKANEAPEILEDCMSGTQTQGTIDTENASEDHSSMMLQMSACKGQMDHEEWLALQACLNRNGATALPQVTAACTVALNNEVLPKNERSFLFVNRGDAYQALGDKRGALGDYTKAIELTPHNAYLYYNRGTFYVAQSDYDAALRDFNTALGINRKFVPALLQRANIYRVRGNLSGALADYSEAVLLQPKNAVLWTERGYVYLCQHDYEDAVKDEAEAIRLDPKLARAYFFRGAAFGELGDPGNAASNINAALHLDPSLNSHLVTKGKDVSLTLPLPP